MEKLEIYDEDTLNEFELRRQNNIIRNYEFFKLCGKNVFLYSNHSKTPDGSSRYTCLYHTTLPPNLFVGPQMLHEGFVSYIVSKWQEGRLEI